MRYEVVKELQAVGDDVHVECTGDPAELKEVTLKAEVCMQGRGRVRRRGAAQPDL